MFVKSMIFVQIDNDIFTTTVKYNKSCKESKRLWCYPIPFDSINICSSDLYRIIKDKSINFSLSCVEYIALENNVARNKIIWNCIYKDSNYKDIEIDAVSGEVIRIMES